MNLVSVLVQAPVHSPLGSVLSYRSELTLAPGSLVRVPLGKRELLGIVWGTANPAGVCGTDASIAPEKLKAIVLVLQGIEPLSSAWRQLVSFAADYYQRSAGEVALAALPPQLRVLSALQLSRRLRRSPRPETPANPGTAADPVAPQLTPEQQRVIDQIHGANGPFLLFGATGSGKTEVYLQLAQQLLQRDPAAQVLVMVPEINLTPQLEARLRARLAPHFGASALACLHSGMTAAQRLHSWLSVHRGVARIVLGTRMAIFASMPRLKLIIVDEEHDPSYKSQEGARYSARDLAVYRARLEGAKVLLASATPSLESWHHSRPAAEGGRYMRLLMPSRIGEHAALPQVRRLDMKRQPKKGVLAAPLLQAIVERVARDEQSLIFLNRRGYAPVLHCPDCDWKSECSHCSAYRVFHKTDRTLRCHHCGYTERVPRACPACGNPDIAPIGRGTERLEEHLTELLAAVRRPNGQAVRVARIDADSTRLKGELEAQLARVHAGEVDVLVGTQMVAKGHDFRRITLVAAINPDGALFASDFRAGERLFALLQQAGGRAGRDAELGLRSELWLQTTQPQHPLFDALRRHDYELFAATELEQRKQAGLPPFSFQALVRAEARTQQAAQEFLSAAKAGAQTLAGAAQLLHLITLYPAVPMSMQRVANVERAQMLIESPSRSALQKFLTSWQRVLHETRQQAPVLRWAIDVDPLSI